MIIHLRLNLVAEYNVVISKCKMLQKVIMSNGQSFRINKILIILFVCMKCRVTSVKASPGLRDTQGQAK